MLLYSICFEKLKASELSPTQLGELQDLLGAFREIFVVPIILPPTREHDHKIPLVHGAKPPNIQPYHYDLLQKIEIETSWVH